MKLTRRKSKGNWHASYTDATGKRIRKSTGTPDKQAAQKILDAWHIESVTSRNGVSHTKLTCDELLKQYIEYLSGTGEAHQQKTENRIRRIMDAAAWMKPQQITQYEVETIVRSLPNERNGKPMSLHTQAHYLTAMKMFTKWLATVRKVLLHDPLAVVKKPNWQPDRRITRRFLLPAEWRWLKLTPNALLYEVAIQTGYRASELLQLNPTSLRDDGTAYLFLPAKHTKNKQAAKQYITEPLARKVAGNLPLRISDHQRLAELLREDLAIARWFAANDSDTLPEDFLRPLSACGDVLDFHALRHTCGAWLAIAGVHPKVIQSVMRHSSISLTLDTYGHLMPGAEKDAVSHFDKLLGQ